MCVCWHTLYVLHNLLSVVVVGAEAVVDPSRVPRQEVTNLTALPLIQNLLMMAER